MWYTLFVEKVKKIRNFYTANEPLQKSQGRPRKLSRTQIGRWIMPRKKMQEEIEGEEEVSPHQAAKSPLKKAATQQPPHTESFFYLIII